ncbi:glycosyltransferase [[Clostridium] dakarense]|uniref:glycosyltransferase n=1 Tax=Faecalimicrobium dakarense TaxID=1301100 RepID=UPI0004B21044|nr:glycosyltransferase [[Clostridium] dakarense]
MRIAMLTNNYKPFIGGVPISVERLTDGLKEIGHEVFVFAPSYDNQVYEEHVIRCKSKRSKKDRHVLPKILDAKLEKEFRKLNIDVIHVHHPFLLGNVGLYLGRKYNVPVVFTYHTRYEQYLHYVKAYSVIEERRQIENNKNLIYLEDKILNYAKNNFVPKYLSKFANKCDMIFAPTNLIKENLEDNGINTCIEIVPTGLEKGYFNSNIDEAQEIRSKYKGNKKYLFCTVARLVKEKNLEFIVEALSKLKEKEGDCFNLIMIGDGPLKDELMNKAKSLNLERNIIFLNSIKNEKIGNYYKACDMFLFSSKSETQGIVLLEAMAAKNPVIAIKASGVIDVVKNNINGYMTNDNIEDWVEKISYLMNNESYMENLSQGAYDTSLKYLNSNIAKLVESHYEKVIENYCCKNQIYKKFVSLVSQHVN